MTSSIALVIAALILTACSNPGLASAGSQSANETTSSGSARSPDQPTSPITTPTLTPTIPLATTTPLATAQSSGVTNDPRINATYTYGPNIWLPFASGNSPHRLAFSFSSGLRETFDENGNLK